MYLYDVIAQAIPLKLGLHFGISASRSRRPPSNDEISAVSRELGVNQLPKQTKQVHRSYELC